MKLKIIPPLIFILLLIACGEPEKIILKNDPVKPAKADSTKEETKDDFEWVKFEECLVEIQKPKSWHFYKTASSNSNAYFLTPYVFEDLGIFKRGFSLVVVSNVKKDSQLSPSQKVEQYIKNAKTIDPNLKIKNTDMQDLKGTSFLIKDPKGTPDSLISSIFLIANDKEDVLYTIIFQYELKDWNDMQPVSKQMLKNIKINRVGF